VNGRVLNGVSAHGKHLFYEFDNKLTVHVHLGLHGAFRMLAMPGRGESMPEARGQVRLRIVGGPKILELTGPTACEVFDEAQVQKLLDRLGPDLLDPRADAEWVWQRISKRRTPIGQLLMDQSVVSGIGNVFRAEILYRQHLHPLVPGHAISRKVFDALWTDSVQMLRRGLKLGHIVTVEQKDIGKPLSRATDADRFLIYRRPTCRRCGARVQQMTLAGRDCFFCPKEQKSPRGIKLAKLKMHPVVEKKRASRGRNHGEREE
jgi:endonuclease-8